jgi:hypothetical protein
VNASVLVAAIAAAWAKNDAEKLRKADMVDEIHLQRAEQIALALGESAKNSASADNLCIAVIMLDHYNHDVANNPH